ncbi:Telomerase protein component 1 [Puccinia graminis f. sp. tritici]|uniref:Telomerase protein component 1 n=1 Tax=Puccinia graminis f. sp. tritici TaxID=56615 RepID=A0A5B0N9H5_PUCGR|nr:Telomerase protein component 1 [Puccinia graminis f. sp. tritici]
MNELCGVPEVGETGHENGSVMRCTHHRKAALPNDPLDPTTKPDPRKALIKTSTAQDASVHTKPISPSDTLPQVVPVPSTSPL